MFDKFIKKLQKIFYEKYYLKLKKLDLETFEINGNTYINDVKELVLEKQDFKLVKLKTDEIVLKNKHQIQSIIDAPNAKELKSFFLTMMKFYEEAQSNLKIEKYLTLPKKDETTNKLFKILRPDCPYVFSKLMDDNVSKNKFMNYASNCINKNF